MTPPRRIAAFVLLAVVLAAVFVRLGIWQLDRRAERRALNDVIAARLALPPVPFGELAGDTALADRRATISGSPDYDHEIVLAGRTRNGSPGVHILTPIRVPGRDTAVLVNRGWVYSPDAKTVDLSRWREPRAHFSGFTQVLSAEEHASRARSGERTVRQLSYANVAGLLPYPVSRTYLVAQDSAGENTPVRLETRLPGEGPHLSYAIQWFSFATIAVVGAAVVVLRARRSDGAQLAG